MKIRQATLSFPPSPSPGVKNYFLYMEESPNPVTYESQKWDLGKRTEVDLSTLDGIEKKDGKFNIGITAADAVGNESSMSKKDNVPLDFLPPNPPGQPTIVYA